jgi:hypothetical protein
LPEPGEAPLRLRIGAAPAALVDDGEEVTDVRTEGDSSRVYTDEFRWCPDAEFGVV